MIEYTKILKFKYNNNKYQLLIDDQDRYFYLKIDDNNNYTYVTLKEYLELNGIFCRRPDIMNAERKGKKMHIVPKIIIGTATVATVLTLPVLASAYKTVNAAHQKFETNYQEHIETNGENSEEANKVDVDDIQRHVSFVVEDSDEELVLDTKSNSDILDYIYIYDMAYLDDYFPYEDVSKEEMLRVLEANPNISERYKVYIREYIDALYEKYPNVEKRVFYENLRTLKIVECTERELMLRTLSKDSCACYNRVDNVIYTRDNYVYEKGTWEYQVIMHELSHALRTARIKIGDKEYRIQGEGPSLSLTIADEALNSIFAVSLLDYEERDIAYQLQSNYFTVILECMDDYSIEDYVNHNLSYFAKKLDEQNGDNNYAKVILCLMDTQYKDYHSDKIEIDQVEYYPIYDYICDMYYTKYITKDMSYEEARKVADELVERVMFDVPEEYNIDTNRFYENLDSYCELIGIEHQPTRTR